MLTLPLLLLLSTAAQAPASHDDDARAAMALSLACTSCCTSTPAPASPVCPCSTSGTCGCDPTTTDCGCLANGQYRWVATSQANQVALFRGTVQQGNYWHAEGEFRRLVNHQDGGWHFEYASCPVSHPLAGPVTTVSTPAASTSYGHSAPVQRATYPTYYQPAMRAPSYRSSGGMRCSG